MPYISMGSRDEVETQGPFDKGDLAYLIWKDILEWLARGKPSIPPNRTHSFNSYSDVVGVLECVKLEFYRRYVAEYEDIKIRENGDIVVPGFSETLPSEIRVFDADRILDEIDPLNQQ